MGRRRRRKRRRRVGGEIREKDITHAFRP